MKAVEVINAMRTIVDAYDKFEAKKLKIKKKTKAILKGGKSMKFGTIIGIVVGGLALLAAGAAAMYFVMKKNCCCDDCCCDCCDDVFDEFPEEECCCDCECEEVPAEEIAE
ncbi:MAG: hypothetical protein IJE83_03680 [Oscillospiraceae bacterium]|nr:hypothetical protein [Oscillospiraceae bacterium]MBQ2795867.1 hypothetical protein [Oscillospiraceae bacterium]MBQ2861871.1 hypothetical protein [Oscillospiraceae bacterium]MBQ2998757.1 hypothetical protein [Oscillospiraceae bacterium]